MSRGESSLVVWMTPDHPSLISAWPEEEINTYHTREDCPESVGSGSPDVLMPVEAASERVGDAYPCGRCVSPDDRALIGDPP